MITEPIVDIFLVELFKNRENRYFQESVLGQILEPLRTDFRWERWRRAELLETRPGPWASCSGSASSVLQETPQNTSLFLCPRR